MPINVTRHSKIRSHCADGRHQQPEHRHPGLGAAVFAGDTLHWTSQQDAHLAAGHTVSLAAAGSVGLHSANGGLRAIAQDGLVSVQAHQGEQAWTAQQAITVTSSNNAIEILAPGKITLNGASTAITLDGTDITLAMPGELDIKGAKHAFVGPGADAARLPMLPSTSLNEPSHFIELNYHYDDLEPVKHAPFKLTFKDGTTIQGRLDEYGFARLEGVPAKDGVVELGQDTRPWQAKNQVKNPHAALATDASSAIRLINKLLS